MPADTDQMSRTIDLGDTVVDPEGVTELLARHGDTIRQDPRATIVPARAAPEIRVSGALGILEQLCRDGLGSVQRRIDIGETLGQGGMGVVQRARQVPLGRDVAVKRLRPEKRSPRATAELLYEAWITGSLEHPNVVPIHGMELDDDGEPFIVLKHIDGVTWGSLMAAPDEVARRFGEDDLLAWNLDILLQVINAVRYAHSRGIVHRDLKPDNVMIGEFGEVYVLDWGIAVSLRDDGSGRLPLARDATDMAGTPCYMAPEMLGGHDPAITERTDIYLLGAILYEIITGSPPHGDKQPLELLTSVTESRPPLPDDVPAGLAAICRLAMAPNPEQRYQSAEAIHRAISEFSRRRGATQLAEHALLRVDELERLLAGTRVGSEAHREEAYRLYGACRFGFDESLLAWSDNHTARAGMLAATEAMIGYELAQGDARAAAALLADLTRVAEPPAQLRERVARAMERRREDQERLARLEQLGRDHDLSIASRPRVAASLVALALWTLAPLLAVFRDIGPAYPGNLRMVTWSLASLAVFLAVIAVARKSLLTSPINRRLAVLVALMLGAQCVLHAVNHLAGFPPVVSQVYQQFLWFCVLTAMAVTVERRLAPAALGYLTTLVVAALWPEVRFLAMVGGNTVLSVNIVLIWLPRAAADQVKP